MKQSILFQSDLDRLAAEFNYTPEPGGTYIRDKMRFVPSENKIVDADTGKLLLKVKGAGPRVLLEAVDGMLDVFMGVFCRTLDVVEVAAGGKPAGILREEA